MTTPLPSPTLDHVREALILADFDVESAWMHMVPRPRVMKRPYGMEGDARLAAVLLLLYPRGDDLAFLLTRRTDSLSKHKGQVSLPGGSQDGSETPQQTALREACEELAICVTEDEIDILGQLSEVYLAVSDFKVCPIVAYASEMPSYTPDPVEVADVLEMSLPMLLDDNIKRMEHWKLEGFELDVPFYRVNGHNVWGATAIMLSELETRLRVVLDMSAPVIGRS